MEKCRTIVWHKNKNQKLEHVNIPQKKERGRSRRRSGKDKKEGKERKREKKRREEIYLEENWHICLS